MVMRSLICRQTDSEIAGLGLETTCFRSAKIALAFLFIFALGGCRSWPSGVYRSSVTDRVIEFKAGNAYITEGQSTQKVPYEVEGDGVVLKLPFSNEVLRRMPNGTLAGMGETLFKMEAGAVALTGSYVSVEGEYTLRFIPQSRAIYTRLGRSMDLSYTVNGDQITLNHGEIHIPVTRRVDGSLETPDAVLRKED